VYEKASGVRPGPRVINCAQARGDLAMLSIVIFPLATFWLNLSRFSPQPLHASHK